MNIQEFKKWLEENSVSRQNVHCNGLDYIFCTMHDGWIAIFLDTDGIYEPLTQAKTEKAALDYIELREAVNFPFQYLVDEKIVMPKKDVKVM